MRASIRSKLVYLAIVCTLAGSLTLGYLARAPVMKVFGIKSKHKHSGPLTIYTCGMHPQVRESEPGTCPICQMKLVPVGGGKKKKKKKTAGERKILYWRAPMNPTERYDGPGKTAMGMDRVPVYADMDATQIKIDPATVQTHGVLFETVRRRALAKKIEAVGHVDYNEKRITVVTARVNGWIERLYVDRIGQLVKRGQPLIALYSPELVSTQEELLLALKYRRILKDKLFKEVTKGTVNLLSTVRRRLQLFEISKGQIRRVERTGRIRRRLVLYAKTSGVVVDKPTFKGRFVKAGKRLFQLADLSTVWVYAHIYESDVLWIREGQMVTMELALGGAMSTSKRVRRRFSGKISYVYPYMDEKTRTLRIRMEFKNPGQLLKPGMYTTISIRSARPKSLVISRSAVLRSGTRDLVLIAMGRGRFQPRQIWVGSHDNKGNLEVLKGLKQGERIVKTPNFLIDSESRLKEALLKMRLQHHMAPQKPSSKPTSKKLDSTSKPSSKPGSTDHKHKEKH